MSRTIQGDGPRNAKIVIVGEAPGRSEDSQGRPFVGSSGQLLEQMLSCAGIPRTACYLTYLFKQRLPGDNFDILYEDNKRRVASPLLVQCRTDLEKELLEIQPNVIITLGAEPTKALIGKGSIDKWRGSVVDTRYGKVCPTYAPGYVLKVYAHRSIVELDMRQALKESLDRSFHYPDHKFQVDPNFEDVIERLNWIIKTKPKIAFDIETCYDGRGFTSLIRCLGLAWSETEAICIPFTCNSNRIKPGDTTILLSDSMGINNSRWTEEQEFEILGLLNKLFLDKDIEKTAQNFPFDATYLARDFGFNVKGLWMDTMIVFHACFPELPKSLDFLTSIYTNKNYYADYSPADDLSTWTYNCMDVVATYEIAEKLFEEAKEAKVWEFYKTRIEPAMFALTRAQNRGVDVDKDKIAEILTRKEASVETDLEELERICGHALNPRSPKQMKERYYGELRLPPVVSRKTKKPSLDDDAVYKLSTKFPKHKPELDLCLKVRKDSHTVSFLTGLSLTENRLCTSYNIAGTVNGRLSSSATIFGEGTNMQNITRGEMRSIIIAPKDHVLIKTDYSQAEVRFVVWDANIEHLMERLMDPEFDIHTWHASKNVYVTSEANITKSMRSIAKAGVHGGNYGLGPQTAAAIYRIPYQDAKMSIDAYHQALSPELPNWWRDIESQLHTTRCLRTILGRRRMFLGRFDQGMYRSAYSFRPQGMISDMINYAFAKGEDTLKKERAYPAIQVHDEIVWMCPINTVERAIPKIRSLMEVPIDMGRKHPLIIPIEMSIGLNWHERKDWVFE